MLVGCQMRNQMMSWSLALSCGLAAMTIGFSAKAQNRVDLEDLNIKGELLNDNRLRTSSREMQKITDRVSYRENFRKEATDGLEVNWSEPEAPAGGESSGGDQ